MSTCKRRACAWWCLISWSVVVAVAPISADSTTKPAAAPQMAPAKADLPPSVDLRPEFKKLGLKPRSQGHRPTCSVFTTAGAMEFALSKCLGRPSPLSVEYLNWAANQVIGNKTKSRGQFFRHLLKGFDRYGICLESDMPYLPKFDPEMKPSEAARKKAEEIRSLGLQIHPLAPRSTEEDDPNLFKDNAVRKVKETLLRGYPVAAGSSHSLLLVGYKDDPTQPGGGIFLTRDSGKGRYSSVTYEHVKTRMGGFFTVEPPAAPSSGASPQTQPAAPSK